MTEQEWLASADPQAMLRLYTTDEMPWPKDAPAPIVSDRKLRLWVEACRVKWPEQAGDTEELDDPEGLAEAISYWKSWGRDKKGINATFLREIIGNPFRPVVVLPRDIGTVLDRGAKNYRQENVVLTAWLTPTVLSLAKAAYDDRDFALLPLLADALEDAGCPQTDKCSNVNHEALGFGEWPGWGRCLLCQGTGRMPHPLLAHLRSPGPHVRGCWALDLLLDQE